MSEDLIFKFVCEEYPPYEYLLNNNPVGMEIEVIEAVCREMKVKYSIEFMPWARVIKSLKTGEVDCVIGILKLDERKTYLLYPDLPISKDSRIILSRKDYPLEIKNISNLDGKTVGVVRGYKYDNPEFDSSLRFKKDEAVDTKMLFDKLSHKRYDLIVINQAVAKHYAGSTWSNFKVHPYKVTETELFCAFSKKSKISNKVFPKFNKTLNDLHKSKKIQKIWSRY
jgi:polar amino acid transport system substrate-binding protein